MKKIIGFVTAGLEFNGNSLNEKALGGSESAMIYMAKELAKFDNMVFVYCLCDKPGVYDNVAYLPLEQFYDIKVKTFDVLIVSRYLEVLCPSYISNYTVFWMHDTWINTFPTQLHLCDKVFLLSEYQKSIWVNNNKHYEKMIHLTTNGYDSELVKSLPLIDFENKKNNYIYASRPERGLKHLLKNIWSKVLKINPKAVLHICHYGNDSADTSEITKATYQEISRLLKKTKNVVMLGKLTKPEYYKKLSECGYMLYPCDFPEISCINAIEAQALGCLVISSNQFALKETVKSDTLVDGVVGDSEYCKQFLELVDLYQDSQLYTHVTNKAKKQIANYSWSNVAASWENYFNNEFEIRYEKYKDKIFKRLSFNSDHVTRTIVDENYDKSILNKIRNNNFSYDYFVSATAGPDSTITPKDINEIPLNARQMTMVSFLDDHFEKINKKITVLELGCYDGALSGTLYKNYHDVIEKVIAYDGFQTALDAYKEIWTKNEGCNNIEFICDDILNLQNHNLKADLIIVGELLEHVIDYKAMLQNVHNCLNKGGLVIYSTPSGPWESIRIKEKNETIYTDHHLHHFEMCDLMQIFEHQSEGNDFFLFSAPVGMMSYRGEYCSNYIFGYTNNYNKPFCEYDPLLKAKKLRPYFDISTCMIVRNEENNLYKCLNSVKGISDEIIIVDTGSTDDSKEICKKFTDKIYDLKWSEEDGVGSFERARNFSVDKSTGDWIFWIDADEQLTEGFNLGDCTRSIYVDSYGILQKQIMIEGDSSNDQYPDRFFRKGVMQFYGVIHELPKQHPLKENDLLDILLPKSCRLNHFGYIDSDTRYSKVFRNHQLLLKNIKKYPELLDNQVYLIRDNISFYQYYQNKQYLETALEIWEKFPKDLQSFKDKVLWNNAFKLMNIVYTELEKEGKKFIKKKIDKDLFLFSSSEEFDQFKSINKI